MWTYSFHDKHKSNVFHYDINISNVNNMLFNIYVYESLNSFWSGCFFSILSLEKSLPR